MKTQKQFHMLVWLLALSFILTTSSSAFSQKKLNVKEFNFSDCKDDCKIGINHKKQRWGKLQLNIGINEHCCMKYESGAEIKNDTLYVYYKKYGQPCRCYCNYELTYTLKGAKKRKYSHIEIVGVWHEDWDTPEKRRKQYKDRD